MIMHQAAKQESSHIKQDKFNVLHWTLQTMDMNPKEHHWDMVEQGILNMKVRCKNLQEYNQGNMDRNLK